MYKGFANQFEFYEHITGGALSRYICELTLKGHSDDDIAVALGVRWTYLFNGLTWFDWRTMVREFRELQSFPNECYKEVT